MSNKIMKLMIMLCIMTMVFAISSSTYARVVEQPKNAGEKKEAVELVKKGAEAPNLTMFYLGEVQGWITPCG
jgi:uncharacterized protein YpmB